MFQNNNKKAALHWQKSVTLWRARSHTHTRAHYGAVLLLYQLTAPSQ